MSIRGAPEGNHNAAKGRMFYAELRKVFVQNPERLRKVAEGLIQAAEDREPWAVKELMDRMDGKPVQVNQLENTDGTPLTGIMVTFVNSSAEDDGK
jgi:hypothetical protein